MTDQTRWVAYYVEDPSKPAQPGAVRIMCLSDTHSCHDKIPKKRIKYPADIAIHAGDFTNVGKREDVIKFREWFKNLPTTHKLLIAGNHDLSFDDEIQQKHPFYFKYRRYTEPPELSKKEIACPEIIYAEESVVELMGIKFYCSPRSPFIEGWGFPSRIENEGKEWEKIDDSIDVVVTHSPPAGILDFEIGEGGIGDPYLAQKIQKCKTPLHIFGHAHCCNGCYRHGNTLHVNCATVNINNKYKYPPIYIDLIKTGEKFDEPDRYLTIQELIDLSFFKNPLYVPEELEES